MSVIQKIEEYWRGVCDPRSSSLVNGKFDRTSRRCQSSFNIHSHAHQTHNLLFTSKKNNNSQRKLTTPRQQHYPQSASKLIISSPCHVCEETTQNPPNGVNKSTGFPIWQNCSSCVSANNLNYPHQHYSHHPNASNHPFPSINDSTTVGHGTTKLTQQSDFRDREDVLFEAIEDKKSICPNPPVNYTSQYESVKMRLQKPEGGRPKSLEYSQRRAWMRLYHNMEVSDVESSVSKLSANIHNPVNSPSAKSDKKGTSKPRSKSILHLHRLDSQPDVAQDKDRMDTLSNASDDSQCSSLKQSGSSGGVSGTGTSLFQRFSKTFSLRFGSGSSPSSRKAKKVKKYPVGSSPDLFHRVENENVKQTDSGWKWRQSSLNDRDEKCLSGDSGISILQEEANLRSRSTRRARRIQSENIDAILEAQSSSSSSSSSNINLLHQNNSPTQPLPTHMDSPTRKLSLVEIPDHIWDENNSKRASRVDTELLNERKLSLNNNNQKVMTKSYEDLLEAKLDDDGFVSDEHENLGLTSNYPHHQSQKALNRLSESSLSTRIQSPRSKSVPRVTKLDFNANNYGGIRGKVVGDILKTEHNYVKTLNDIVQGFLVPMRKREDLFNSRVISNIFVNIEDILRLHARFLEALVSSLDKGNLADSTVGHIFTLWTDEFDLYCDYCCNNPISQITLQNLTTNSVYTEFFEACRRLQMMDKLPLHGFLLRPIQRICQYHLQLSELQKNTTPEHKDFDSTSEALYAMRKVAQKVNDTQRKFDAMKDILDFQSSIDLFEGPPLVDRNSMILHQGELIKTHQNRKHKEVHVAIFNTELVITRKRTDMNKKSGYLFLGRVDLSHRKWHNVDSNVEDEVFGFVHNSWRIYSKEKSCWILFTTMTATEKTVWLKALDTVASLSSDRDGCLVEPKMKEKVKELMVEQAQAKLLSSQQSQNQIQSSYQNNTLPKSKKATKLKQQGVEDRADQMLIEVARMKRSSFTSSSSNSTSQKDRTSTFYV